MMALAIEKTHSRSKRRINGIKKKIDEMSEPYDDVHDDWEVAEATLHMTEVNTTFTASDAAESSEWHVSK